MPRLERGQNEKIDRINDLVYAVKCNNDSDAMTELLGMFKPLLLKLCKKWSEYFNDSKHTMKRFDELLADAEYWFYHYTTEKYEIDGDATYNKFINDHIDQRIRYIYECELKYQNRHIFPDPDKHDPDVDMFEHVIYNYSSSRRDISSSSTEDEVVNDIDSSDREKLAHKVLSIINTGHFNERERKIFTEIVYNGRTHESMGEELNISRTRVTQLLRKTKAKLFKLMDKNQDIWNLIEKTDIEFKEQ